MGDLQRFKQVSTACAVNAPKFNAAPSRSLSDQAQRIVGLVLGEINRLPSHFQMDELDCDLYVESCRGIRSEEQLQSVIRELRRACRFRPIPAEFTEIVRSVVGLRGSEINRLGDGQRRAYRLVAAPTQAISGKSHSERIAEILRRNHKLGTAIEKNLKTSPRNFEKTFQKNSEKNLGEESAESHTSTTVSPKVESEIARIEQDPEAFLILRAQALAKLPQEILEGTHGQMYEAALAGQMRKIVANRPGF